MARRWRDIAEDGLARLPVERWRNPRPLVSVLRLDGVIGRLGPWRTGLTLAGHERAIARAFAPRRLAAVALSINSPGGSPVQSAAIARRIRQLADEKGVPVYAFAEDVAASGGYWLATAADEIYADQASIVGSIGVIAAGFGLPRLIARAGIERRVYASGRRKAMLDPFREEEPEDIARLKEIQADIHAVFRDHVRARRGERLKGSDEALFEGEVWTGREALELGLIDGIGDLRTVMREKLGERVRLHPVTPRPGLLRRLGLGRAGPDAAAAALVAAAEEWAAWRRFGL